MKREDSHTRKTPVPDDLSRLLTQEMVLEGLRGCSSTSREFTEWRKETEKTLKNLFGEDAAEVQEFNTIYYSPVFLTCRMGDEAFEEAYRNGLEEARVFLLSVMEKIRRPG
jgi:hypothetical protein